MEKTTKKLIIILLILLGVVSAATARASDKNVVAAVQKILDAENQARAKLDEQLMANMKALQDTSATQNAGDLLDSALDRAETKVSDMKTQLSENHLRIEFLNQFISALDQCGDIRGDSPKILLDLSHKDMMASIEANSESKVWLFEIYLSIAIRDIMEPSENFADFVKRYIAFSSLHDPRSPSAFMKDRKYIEGPVRPNKSPLLDDE